VHEYSVVKIPEWIGFDVAALVACGVPTGWGSAVRAGDVRAGQTVVIYGAGGVGMNAVQGARFAGARRVVVVDPVAFKRDTALSTFGATHAFATAEEAFEFIREDTWGDLADRAIITVGILHDKVIADAVNIIGKTGQVTITAVGGGHFDTNSGILLGFGRKIQGSIYGGCSPLVDVPALIRLYEAGDLKLEELITRRYKLDEINQGYQDMLDGKNVRGVIVHEH
jgi:S-(hydroxymethyl)glutathione dehydrogenase/alcohol dehydrogenase